jgi:predicted GNAT family acetyltransferase
MTALQLRRYRRAAEFLADAGPWLAEREAEHNLILGLSGVLQGQADVVEETAPYFAVIRSDAGPVAAAMRTPPMNLILSEIDDAGALALLAAEPALADLPGATGPPEAVDAFGREWTALHGGSAVRLMEERIYRLSRVVGPRAVTGARRRATAEDRELLADWMVAFDAEALPDRGADDARRLIAAWDPQTGREFWLWEVEGRAVSMVGAGSPTPTGIRIGPVYTPPEDRGRGYASALTASVSQWHLDRGRRFCFLYTNLANPTANHIYQEIGYEPVTDARMVRFVA